MDKHRDAREIQEGRIHLISRRNIRLPEKRNLYANEICTVTSVQCATSTRATRLTGKFNTMMPV